MIQTSLEKANVFLRIQPPTHSEDSVNFSLSCIEIRFNNCLYNMLVMDRKGSLYSSGLYSKQRKFSSSVVNKNMISFQFLFELSEEVRRLLIAQSVLKFPALHADL